jgi:hypothetical protein
MARPGPRIAALGDHRLALGLGRQRAYRLTRPSAKAASSGSRTPGHPAVPGPSPVRMLAEQAGDQVLPGAAAGPARGRPPAPADWRARGPPPARCPRRRPPAGLRASAPGRRARPRSRGRRRRLAPARSRRRGLGRRAQRGQRQPRPRRRRRRASDPRRCPPAPPGRRGQGWHASTRAACSCASVSTRTTPVCDSPRLPRGIGGVAGVGARCALALDGHDRLGAAELAGDAAELAGVAERLEVQQHQLGALVVGPVLEQVVGGHVGPVPMARTTRPQPAPPMRSSRRRRSSPTPTAAPPPAADVGVANVAQPLAGSVLITPGSWARASGRRSDGRPAAPGRRAASGPDSAKPAVMTMPP